MLWIIIGIVGGTLFVGLSVFLLNPPEALLKTILDDKKENDKNTKQSMDDDATPDKQDNTD